ncbi:MAG: S41 family peptidase, partial [Pseudomonadales bacterium]|nr:S41 family peptidase [Pseudomonadales bacterium]
DLVLDLRYNGGGYLDIANELAFMIAGSEQAEGKVFSEIQFNDKHPSTNPVTGAALEPELFHTSARGFSTSSGTALPTLNLERVFVLTGPGTCSASESIINGLRGIDVEVIQIGTSTCGKPYGFYAFDNCGTTYFSIQFRGTNAKGFGDYTDGFSPTNEPSPGTALPGCFVPDDFGHALGDPFEDRLNTALAYRSNPDCPALAKAAVAHKSASTSDVLANGKIRQPFFGSLGLLRD